MDFWTYPEGCTFHKLSDIQDKKVTVMGLGLNGGGEACVRFFLLHGAFVTVTDMKTEEQLKPTMERLSSDKNLDLSRLKYVLGEHRIEDFENADCVIKNPGVKIQGNKYLACAKHIESDISIFLHFTKAPIIAITGSKGKSSTVSAIYYGLSQAGFKTFLGGNITVSPLTFLDQTSEKTPVVLELSSWQLSDLRGRKVLKPKISLITKIVPDHQNWYGNMEDYVEDKRLIYKDQTEDCYSIFDNEGDEIGTGPKDGGTWGDFFATESNAKVLRYGSAPLKNGNYGVWQTFDKNGKFEGKALLPGMSEPVSVLEELSIPGSHMRINVLNAALVMLLMGVKPEDCKSILAKWPGIDHRLQFFHSYTNKIGGTIRFYNDSCATVPEAAVAASQSFGKSVYLMTGGTDKGLELTPMIESFTGKVSGHIQVKKLYLLDGSATQKILPALKEAKVEFKGPFESLEKMLAAVKADFDMDESKDNVAVFSPGATSFGMFANEFDRGNKFMKGIKKIFC